MVGYSLPNYAWGSSVYIAKSLTSKQVIAGLEAGHIEQATPDQAFSKQYREVVLV